MLAENIQQIKYLNQNNSNIFKAEKETNLINKFYFKSIVDEIELNNSENKESYINLKKLVPKINMSYVDFIIENEFNGDVDKYIETIPLFFDVNIWNIEKAKICNKSVLTKKTNRQAKKLQQELLLHSSHLLKLIGSGRQKVINKSLIKMYKDDMQASDLYIEQLRLVNANGSIIKLDTNEQKQYKTLAGMYKLADTIDLIAQDKHFTNSMITFTLPPTYHCNPQNKNCSYNGVSPAQAKAKLMNYWKLFRAKLSNNGLVFGDDILGLQVIECQGDSTLHLHTVIYHSNENQKLITDCLSEVQESVNRNFTEKTEIVKFDIQYSKIAEKDYQRGSSYLMKYLNKTHTVYSENNQDHGALRNQTARWFYNVRGFNFYGVKGAITKFNYLVKTYKEYENTLFDEIITVLKNRDLYSFIKHYEKYFTNEYHKTDKTKVGKGKFIAVTFSRGLYKKAVNQAKQDSLKLELFNRIKLEVNKLSNRLEQATKDCNNQLILKLQKMIDKKLALTKNLEISNELIQEELNNSFDKFDLVIMQKKIFSIFQSNNKTENIKDVKEVDLNSIINVNLLVSFENAKLNQADLDNIIKSKVFEYKSKGVNALSLYETKRISNRIYQKLKDIDNTYVVQLIKVIQGKAKAKTTDSLKRYLEQKNEEIDIYDTEIA